MAKIVDITEKLAFNENPYIKVKDKKFEVCTDAETVLKIIGKLGDEKSDSPKMVVEMYHLIFSEKTRKEIAKLGLKFKDFETLVTSAIDMITGDEEERGE